MNQKTKTISDYLPENTKYLMTIISFKSVLILIKNYAGGYIEVPMKAKAGHVLDRLIGMDDFKKLAGTFGGTQLEIPRCAYLKRAARDIKILNDKRSGVSVHILARQNQLTVRAIRDAIKRAEQQTGEEFNEETQNSLDFIL